MAAARRQLFFLQLFFQHWLLSLHKDLKLSFHATMHTIIAGKTMPLYSVHITNSGLIYPYKTLNIWTCKCNRLKRYFNNPVPDLHKILFATKMNEWVKRSSGAGNYNQNTMTILTETRSVQRVCVSAEKKYNQQQMRKVSHLFCLFFFSTVWLVCAFFHSLTHSRFENRKGEVGTVTKKTCTNI